MDDLSSFFSFLFFQKASRTERSHQASVFFLFVFSFFQKNIYYVQS